MRLTRLCGGVTIVGALAIAGCTSPPATAPEPGPATSAAVTTPAATTEAPATRAVVAPAGPVVVILDAFSGNPNPEWTLTEAQGRELATLLAGVGDCEPTTWRARLGFRGFVVRQPPAEWDLVRATSSEFFVETGGGVQRCATGGGPVWALLHASASAQFPQYLDVIGDA